jgi:hypothetical protein
MLVLRCVTAPFDAEQKLESAWKLQVKEIIAKFNYKDFQFFCFSQTSSTYPHGRCRRLFLDWITHSDAQQSVGFL